MSRPRISLKTKLAATLCHMLRVDENGELVRIISHDEAKSMSEDAILARFDFDHDPIPKAHDGPDSHWNLTPRPRSEHRKKTAERDIPMIAKSRRIKHSYAAHRARMDSKITGDPVIEKPKRKWPSRKIRSKGFGK